METRDLISFTPKAFMVIDQKKQFDLLHHPKYEKKYTPILHVLNDGPITLKELEYKYNAIAEEPKKKNTIYSYLQDLEKAGLVKKAGQRVVPGHSFCEWLYDRTAKLFYPIITTDEYFKSKDASSALENTRKLISLYLNQPSPSYNNLRDFIFKTYQSAQKQVGAIFSDNSDEIAKITEDVSFYLLDKICNTLEILMVIINFHENSSDILADLGLEGIS